MEKINGGNLLEGMAEVVAKQVEGNALPLLKPIDAAQDQLEVFGSAAAKADADARLVLEELMDARVRMDCDAVYQQNEWLKQELTDERSRKLVYKEKYEASEERIGELEEKIVELEGEIERQKEEHEEKIRGKDEEITKLKAQLEWVKENPQNVNNYIQGSQYNMGSTHKPTQLAKEIKEEAEDIGVQMGDMKEDEKGNDEIQICKYILVEKVKDNTTYGLGCKPEDDQKRVDGYNRALLHAFNKGGRKLQILQQGEQVGYLDFNNDSITEIYNHFVEILGYQPYTLSAFYKACQKLNWQPAIKIEPSSSKKFQ